jgi:hypothetical protein
MKEKTYPTDAELTSFIKRPMERLAAKGNHLPLSEFSRLCVLLLKSGAHPHQRGLQPEAEVRKQDTELIRQMLEALKNTHDVGCNQTDAAITAANKRLNP